MSNAVTTVAAKSPAHPPRLPASMQRLLADPFTLGDEIPTWSPPVALPGADQLRAAVRELEETLKPAPVQHVRWCLNKLFVLPTANGDKTTAALMADNFVDACGHYPADLWSAATIELLQTKTFRPSPAEMVQAVGTRHSERRRMLERARRMLAPAIAPKTTEQPTATRLERLRFALGVYQRLERTADAARTEREIAHEEGKPTLSAAAHEALSAIDPETAAGVNRKPSTSRTATRCAELARAQRSGTPAPEAPRPLVSD